MIIAQAVGQKAAFTCFNGLAPRGDPKFIAVQFPAGVFSGAGVSQVIDLTIEEMFQQLEFVQTIVVDNSTNASNLTVTPDINQVPLYVPSLAQAILPIISPEKTRLTLTAGGALANVVNVILLNVPMGAAIWKVA